MNFVSKSNILYGISYRVMLVGTVCLGLFSCKPKDPTPNPSGYPERIDAIISTSCAVSGCHVGPEAPENLDLSTWELMFQGSDFGAVAIPHTPDWSHLFQHLNTFADLGIQATPVMPPDAPPLSREEVLDIKNWIIEGAKDKNDQYRWTQAEQISTGKLFALCAGSDLIAVSDLSSNLIMQFVPVGQLDDFLEAPHYIQASPDQQYLYISLISGGFIEKYRADNYTLVDRVEVGPDPALIQLNEDGTRAVISHWNNSPGTPKLTLLDTENMEIVDQVIGSGDLLSFGHGLSVTQDFKTLYVVANEGNYYAKYELGERGFLSENKIVIAPEQSPFPQPSAFYKPYHCFLSPDESQFFISCSEQDQIRVFDTKNDSLLAIIPTGKYPRLMDYDPISQRLFVACRDEENFSRQGSMQGCVTVIDAANLSFIENIYRLGHRPHGVAVSSTNRKLYVSTENTGGIDPPHHPIEGSSGPPGKYNVVDLETLEVLPDYETEIAVFPNALIVNE